MAPDFAFQHVADFVRVHRTWAAPIVFSLAFGESLPFLSLFIPAWGALVAIGALIDPAGISFWQVWLGGSLGAAFGDWLSFWLGRKFGGRIEGAWPLSRNPALIQRGHRLVRRWGIFGVFFGRFLGPLRAIVPLVAGVLDMPERGFQLANFSSAIFWVWALLKFGDYGLTAVSWLF